MPAPSPALWRCAVGRVLVISSQVAASRVGANATRFVLERLGHEVVLLPTVLLGRHPGWGVPGGGATPLELLEGMWRGVAAQGLRFDAAITGYFAGAEQVRFAARVLDAASPGFALVDPVMGDGALYVPQGVAEAIARELVPSADIITPNAWEWDWLKSRGAAARARVVTSHREGERIGALFADAREGWQVLHERLPRVPHGGGDALAGLWVAHRLAGLAPRLSLEAAVGSVYALLREAHERGEAELPLAGAQGRLVDPLPLSATPLPTHSEAT